MKNEKSKQRSKFKGKYRDDGRTVRTLILTVMSASDILYCNVQYTICKFAALLSCHQQNRRRINWHTPLLTRHVHSAYHLDFPESPKPIKRSTRYVWNQFATHSLLVHHTTIGTEPASPVFFVFALLSPRSWPRRASLFRPDACMYVSRVQVDTISPWCTTDQYALKHGPRLGAFIYVYVYVVASTNGSWSRSWSHPVHIYWSV